MMVPLLIGESLLAADGESEISLSGTQLARLCHPDCGELQIPRFARDDNS